MATISENIQTLKSIKSDIKNAIIQKGGSVTDAFGTYAQAITNLPSGGSGGTENEDALITRMISGTYYNNRVSGVGYGAFYDCGFLESLILPNCLYAGNNAFTLCGNLTFISLQKCSSLGRSAFYYCDKLKEVYLNSVSSVTDIYGNTFYNCTNLTSVYVPASLVDAFKTAQYWSSISNKIVAYTGA